MNNIELKNKVSSEIHRDACRVLVDGLSGIPNPIRAFDLEKIDYVVDNLDTRVKNITSGIIRLVIDALMPKLEEIAYERAKERLKNLIR